MVYTDGYRDAERWRVMPETGQRVSVRGIALSGGAWPSTATAACTASAVRSSPRPCNWAPGTTRQAPRSAFHPAPPGAPQHPHAWLFQSYPRSRFACPSGERLEHGVSLLQTLDGQELERLDNRAAGVIDFIELEIGDER